MKQSNLDDILKLEIEAFAIAEEKYCDYFRYCLKSYDLLQTFGKSNI